MYVCMAESVVGAMQATAGFRRVDDRQDALQITAAASECTSDRGPRRKSNRDQMGFETLASSATPLDVIWAAAAVPPCSLRAQPETGS